MAVVLLALGSRGDVEPLAVLAGALVRHGVEARVVALADYADLVTASGAPVTPIAGSVAQSLEMTHTRVGRLVFAGSAGQGVILRRWVAAIAPAVAEATLSAVRPGDTLVSGILTREVALALVEARRCRMVTMVYTGMLPTVHRECHYLPQHFTGWASYDRWGSRLGWAVSTAIGRPAARATRRRLGLPPPGPAARATAAADLHPIVVAASPLLVPPAPDWPAAAYQTGHLVADPPEVLPPGDVAALLATGRPVVHVGFGSMGGSIGHHRLDVVQEAAARSGVDVVTPALPGMPPGRVDERVLAIAPLPHDWLFPRMAAVVHHGGSGTSYAGLRAGVPSAAVPFGVDQPFHADRLFRLGVGPAPFPVQRMTGERLATLIGELVGSPRSAAYRRNAAEVAVRCHAEDGVGETVRLLERLRLLGEGR